LDADDRGHGPNATSTITAALTTDSLGSAVGVGNLGAFTGLTVAFSDPQPTGATISVASGALSAGTVSTTYNSQNTSGPGHVLATLDNGTATASITVNRPTAVALLAFTAYPSSAGVRLRWTTAVGTRSLGFNLYREERGADQAQQDPDSGHVCSREFVLCVGRREPPSAGRFLQAARSRARRHPDLARLDPRSVG
jgi:hypothetical protein